MKKYQINVSVSPEIHEGEMAHYWSVELHTTDGQFAIAHGWANNLYEATDAAAEKAYELKLVA